jgi:hypothetical protein
MHLRSAGVGSPRSCLPIRVQPGRVPSGGTILDEWFQGIGVIPGNHSCKIASMIGVCQNQLERGGEYRAAVAKTLTSMLFLRSGDPSRPTPSADRHLFYLAYRGWLTGSEATSSDGDASSRCWSGSATSGRKRCARDGGVRNYRLRRGRRASLQPGFAPTFAASRRLQLRDVPTATHAL